MTTERIVTDDRPILASIVGDAEHFLRCVLGQRPWHGRAHGADRVLGIEDVDRIVTSAVRVPAIRMIRDGQRIRDDELCTPTRIGSTTLHDVADARKVLDQFRRGATLVLQSLHRTWSPVSAWCAALEREVGWPVQANAYLTPAGERGLAPHADGHDVIVVQLHGTKSWNLDDLGDVDLDVGEVLYLPAGCTHQAGTRSRASLHLTVGIHRPTPHRIARTAATIAIARGRPAAPTTPEASLGLLRDGLADLDAGDVLRRLRRRPRPHLEGLLAASVTRGPLGESTSIVPAGTWSIEARDGRVVVTWDEGLLSLPERAGAALARLADEGPTEIGQLPGLDPDERMVLARRLLDEGAARAAVRSRRVPAPNEGG